MKYILFLMMILFSSQAVALNCEKQPTCEELGYSMQDNPSCLDDGYLICPFDSNYKKCVNFNCESLGFTKSDKSDWCADIATCKGDKSYTLCQTPCIAWDSDTLSNLAESGKCKIITMKNDITIPTNQGFTLAANTTLDGGGHTLSTFANQANKTVITVENNTAFKNINLHHQDSVTHYNHVYINSSNKDNIVSLENVSLIYDSQVTENQENAAFYNATFIFKDKVDINLNSIHCNVFKSSKIQFAGTNLTASFTNPNGSVFWGSELTFENAQINITEANTFFNGSPFTFKETTAQMNAASLFYGPKEGKYLFEEGSHVSFNITRNMTNEAQHKYNLVLSGTSQNPVFLKFEGQMDSPQVIEITASNSADTLVYKGTTYHPTQTGTTKLSEIPNSQNWKKE